MNLLIAVLLAQPWLGNYLNFHDFVETRSDIRLKAIYYIMNTFISDIESSKNICIY